MLLGVLDERHLAVDCLPKVWAVKVGFVEKTLRTGIKIVKVSKSKISTKRV